MTAPVALVTDSTAGLHALDPATRWRIVPLELEIDGHRVREGPELSVEEFQRLFQEVNSVPATIPPAVDTFVATYESLLAHHDQVLSIHLSAALSQTVAHARGAAARVGEDRVTVVDSRLAGLALGLLCREAESRLDAGADVAAAVADLAEIAAATRVWFSVYTLDFLYLSGRLARTPASRAGHAEDRPILTLQDGRLALVERVVGETTRVERIASLMEGEYGRAEPLVAACVHAGPRGADAAARLEETLSAGGHSVEWHRAPLGPVLCAHTGFDVCGIAVYPRRLSRLG